jgi:hypothetical protein
MPNYPGAANATTPGAADLAGIIGLEKGDTQYLFGVLAAGATQLPVQDLNVQGETPAAPQASIAVCLETSETNSPPMVCFEGVFSGAPGAFNLQIQESDTLADGCFITPTNAAYTVTAVNANNVFRVDLSPTGGKFIRVLLSSRTNPVSLKLKATRLA